MASSEGGSFLPRILSVFYAIFDEKKGPCIVYQVPEDLIAIPSGISSSTSNGTSSPGLQSFTLASDASSTAVSQTSSVTRNARIDRAKSVNSRTNGRKLHHSDSGSHSRDNTQSLRYSRGGRRSTSGGTSATRQLFHFEEISRYVMPHSILCGRLVMCTTRYHRVLGFPVELYGKYDRNFFRFNLCFVFERTADLSCYEPIVRKIGRVLTACEEESCFLSSPATSPKMHAILEQLYEDLNSYSETSIPIDRFNSIELKIFPFYPNPPPVHDWDVPVALINLKKRIEDNWDLTMAKVCPLIDGTNHVARIAFLADCDINLTRKAISHLLYYQVIMMIDIFQFSNMYTLSRSIQWLADETHVRDECGPYVTRSDREIADWPDLLHLYSRLKPGTTVFEWIKQYSVDKFGVDPRRFVSFGVIKGFLRRVHRWPVLLPGPDPARNINTASPLSTLSMSRNTATRGRRSPTISMSRRRGSSLVVPAAPASSPSGLGPAGILASGPAGVGLGGGGGSDPPSLRLNTQIHGFGYGHGIGHGFGATQGYGGYVSGSGDTPPVSAGTTGSGNAIGVVTGAYGVYGSGLGVGMGMGVAGPSKRPGLTRRETYDDKRAGSEWERAQERARRNSAAERPDVDSANTSPRTFRFPRQQQQYAQDTATAMIDGLTKRDQRDERQRRHSLHQQPVSSNITNMFTSPNRHSAMPTLSASSHSVNVVEPKMNSYDSGSGGAATPTPTQAPVAGAHFRSSFATNRMSRSPSTSLAHGPQQQPQQPPPRDIIEPEGLRELLDGTRHTDELGVMFEAGWPLMEKWLTMIGGGKGEGDLGRVMLIIR